MKFCCFFNFMVAVLTINSCLADSVTKTEISTSNAAENFDSIRHNDTVDDEQLTESTTLNTVIVESVPPHAFKDTAAEISENVGKASQIQSSFEDVSKPQLVTVNEDAVSDQLPGVLNQGTLSQDHVETGTVGVISLGDTASADLHQRASSASANAQSNSKPEKADSSNTTSGSLPPIIIVPSDQDEQGQVMDKDEKKLDSIPASVEETPTSEPPTPPVVRAEPKVVEKTSKTLEVKLEPEGDDKSVKSDPAVSTPTHEEASKLPEVGSPSPPPPASVSSLDIVGVPASEIPQEEIPSFSEWTQKQLEEAEKKKGQNKTASPPSSRAPAPSKVRSKNYASPDCGAKIVATNPEAENPNGVLSNSKDEYLINKCSTQRMWLIIELCEAVQAKKIELANFELFSSSPKDFSVYLSHTYPSRDWSSVGQFTAKDERTVQGFNLHPHLFGKFLKVEFNSHYGREHFCCTSLIRVYGTSEFEVLETENEVHSAVSELDDDEDEDEQPIGVEMGKPAKNLFGHATDAVYTIVRKAAEVLVKSGESQNHSQTLEPKNTTALIPACRVRPQHCNTLRYLVVCNNCSEEFYDKVYHLLSCQSRDLQILIESPFVFDGINNSQLCSFYGLDFITKRNMAVPLRLRHEDQLDQAGYLAAMLPAEYISALCNILGVLEGKVVLNNSQAGISDKGMNINSKPSQDSRDRDFKNLLIEHQAPQTCSVDTSFTSSSCQPTWSGVSSQQPNMDVSTSMIGSHSGPPLSSIASEIKPTKTLTKEDAKEVSAPVSEGSASHIPLQKSVSTPEAIATMGIPNSASVQPSIASVSSNERATGHPDRPKTISIVPESASETSVPDQLVLEAPPLDKDKDVAESPFGLESVTLEDQDSSKDLDAIFMEMKALDNNEETSTEASSSLGGSPTIPSSVVTQTKVHTQQAQKESVFLRLSNKIKALERNMSLSGQYLEELSRRYKKQEELSRALNKTLVLQREEARKSKDREQQRDNDLHFLRTQLIQLTATIESFQSERDSWQHKAFVISQHFVLIVIEVVIFGIVVWMCRRIPTDSVGATAPQRKWSTGWRKVNKSHGKHHHLTRRGSLDELSGSCDLKKRRPSEEALQITGSYKDLLVQEENMVIVQGEEISPQLIDSSSWLEVSSSRDQRRRRKRRKDVLMRSSSSNNLAQLQVDSMQSAARKISAPMHSYSLPSKCYENENIHQQSGLFDCSRQPSLPEGAREAADISEEALTPISVPYTTENGIIASQNVAQYPAVFMETATSARNRRSISLLEAQLPFQSPVSQDWRINHEGDSGSNVSGQSSRSKGLDSLEPTRTSSQSDNQSGIIEEKKKKINRKGGLKNMVKKFF